MPNFPTPSQTKPTQIERLQAIWLARSEMETITAENRMKISLLSKITTATHYLIVGGVKVGVSREPIRTWNGPYEVTTVSQKTTSVTDGVKMKSFNISSVLPMTPQTNDTDLKKDLNNIKRLKIHVLPEEKYPS